MKPVLRCNHDLAVRLGAVWPQTTAHHRELIAASDGSPGMLIIRDQATGWPLFWHLQEGATATDHSSSPAPPAANPPG